MSQVRPQIEQPSRMNAGRTIGVMARLLDQQDGLGVYSRELLQHLFALDSTTRYVVLLGSARAQTLFEGFANVADAACSHGAGKLWWDQVLVPRAARRCGADLLFNPKFSLPLLTRIPGVFVLQSCDWYVNPGNYPWWDNLYIRLMLPLYCRKASGLLAISQATLNELTRRTGMKLSASERHPRRRRHRVSTRSATRVSLQKFREHYGYRSATSSPSRACCIRATGKCPAYPGGNNERLMRAYRLYRQRRRNPLPLVVAGRDVSDIPAGAAGSPRRIWKAFTSWGSSRTSRSTRPTSWPTASCSPRSARASASRFWKHWPAAARRSCLDRRRTRRSPAMPRASSIPTTRRTSRAHCWKSTQSPPLREHLATRGIAAGTRLWLATGCATGATGFRLGLGGAQRAAMGVEPPEGTDSMCGICGFNWTDEQLIERMKDTLVHRGPDAEGSYVAPGISLGHRRLSIVDLSASGRQPLSNEDGSVWITFNGEIYNHAQLRTQLEQAGHVFRSRTDTEVDRARL